MEHKTFAVKLEEIREKAITADFDAVKAELEDQVAKSPSKKNIVVIYKCKSIEVTEEVVRRLVAEGVNATFPNTFMRPYIYVTFEKLNEEKVDEVDELPESEEVIDLDQ